MNLLLLHPAQQISEDSYRIEGRPFDHMTRIQKVDIGKTLTAGIVNGPTGYVTIEDIKDSSIVVRFVGDGNSPKPLPIVLCVALPRPQMLNRILQTTATMGVKELIFFQSAKVEKSFWQTPQLQPDKVMENVLLGLEQGRDTMMPNITFEKRFRPFAEDQLPNLCQGKRALIAHPTGTQSATESTKDTLLMIGPEGGFTEREVEMANDAGCETIHLGSRILRVETAVTALLSRLFPIF